MLFSSHQETKQQKDFCAATVGQVVSLANSKGLLKFCFLNKKIVENGETREREKDGHCVP